MQEIVTMLFNGVKINNRVSRHSTLRLLPKWSEFNSVVILAQRKVRDFYLDEGPRSSLKDRLKSGYTTIVSPKVKKR